MNKRIISAVMAAAVAFSAVPFYGGNPMQDYSVTASAADYTEGTYESLTYCKFSDHVVIWKCDTLAEEVVIPAEIEGLPVTEISTYAFQNCYGLTSITIPDSVTNIGSSVFYGTPWLAAKQKENPLVIVNNILVDGKTCEGDVVIPDGVVSIGDNAFRNCYGLTSITIPDSVTSIGGGAFYSCSSLKEITIPDSVTSIDDGAFYDTPWLEARQKENPLVVVNDILIDGKTCEGDVVIPDGVVSIGDNAFHNCYGLTSITIPDGVTSIGECAFYGCDGLTLVIIPNSITSIGNSAFWYCSGLTSIIIPDSVTNIGYEVFSFCRGLTSVTIPDSVTSIGRFAFSYCVNLTSITISDGVTGIDAGAFYGCSGLTSITVPDSVTGIGGKAFDDCSNLESITILNPNCEIYDYLDTICNGYDYDTDDSYFNGTIYGYENSTAQVYAEKYGYNFESLGEYKAPETLLGDANCDGEISVADATLVLQYCGNKDKYKLTEQGLINADVDGTAGISAVDALRIQQYDAGVIEKF